MLADKRSLQLVQSLSLLASALALAPLQPGVFVLELQHSLLEQEHPLGHHLKGLRAGVGVGVKCTSFVVRRVLRRSWAWGCASLAYGRRMKG
jgi:hypothetical protein